MEDELKKYVVECKRSRAQWDYIYLCHQNKQRPTNKRNDLLYGNNDRRDPWILFPLSHYDLLLISNTNILLIHQKRAKVASYSFRDWRRQLCVVLRKGYKVSRLDKGLDATMKKLRNDYESRLGHFQKG